MLFINIINFINSGLLHYLIITKLFLYLNYYMLCLTLNLHLNPMYLCLYYFKSDTLMFNNLVAK